MIIITSEDAFLNYNSLPDLIQSALDLVTEKLQLFATQSNFNQQLQIPFGEGVDLSQYQLLWAQGILNFPTIEVLPKAQINQTDSPGDEGEIFADLVLGKSLTPTEIAQLKAENDHAVATIDGQSVEIEMSFGTTGYIQFGTSSNDQAWGISSDSNGNVYVSGYTGGSLPGNSNLGGSSDAFIVGFDGNGILLGTPVTLSINDISVIEGNSGITNATFTVTLSSPVSTSVSVNYATANGTATAGSDYVAIPTTTLTFNSNETTKTITVQVNGDIQVENNETFFVNLSNLQPNGSNVTLTDNQGQGTITNDDSNIINGTPGRDTLSGTPQDDIITGFQDQDGNGSLSPINFITVQNISVTNLNNPSNFVFS